MYALSVVIKVDPAHSEEFKKAALQHAANTKTNETGCLGFDVFAAEDDPSLFYFHEVYSSKSAVTDVHNKAPYMAEFSQKTGGWIVSRDLRAWNGFV